MGIIGLILMPFLDISSFLIDIYFKIVVVEVIIYWLLQYKIITVHNKYSEKLVSILKMLTEPAYKLIRKKVPPISGIDIAPFVLLVIIIFISSFLSHLSHWINQYM